jgi:hypothetical protein
VCDDATDVDTDSDVDVDVGDERGAASARIDAGSCAKSDKNKGSRDAAARSAIVSTYTKTAAVVRRTSTRSSGDDTRFCDRRMRHTTATTTTSERVCLQSTAMVGTSDDDADAGVVKVCVVSVAAALRSGSNSVTHWQSCGTYALTTTASVAEAATVDVSGQLRAACSYVDPLSM